MDDVARSVPDPAAAALEARLFARLDALSIAHTTLRHDKLFTVEQSRALHDRLPGAHIKNLFLRDKKRALVLVTVLDERPMDLKALRHLLGATGNLSFGSIELLGTALGVELGSVTPYAVLNDTEGRVRFVLDAAILDQPLINAHPLHNAATTTITTADLVRFAAACGHPPLIVDFDAPGGPAIAGGGT
ncbi:MAG: prolyl-tRNA synthetase associated domain-containing protein [Alphaproteobacteria bacterium]|nr:prolyl-tRNA synthetase associated domain-containing protein [Alphaproteobacteria bacterium]